MNDQIYTDPRAADIGDIVVQPDGVYTKTRWGLQYIAPTLAGSDAQASATALRDAMAAEPTPASIIKGDAEKIKSIFEDSKTVLIIAAALALVVILK